MSLALVNIATTNSIWQLPTLQINIQPFGEPLPPEAVIQTLATIDGPVDVYCWYEGIRGLPEAGASFMKNKIFEPLFEKKQDAKLYLYSLQGWDWKSKTTIENLPTASPLGESINKINKTAVECIYSSSFFKYCARTQKNSSLYTFVNEELPHKEWLFNLSKDRNKKNIKVEKFFLKRPSLLDFVKDLDFAQAYSPIQYVEGYYLIQESVLRGLSKKQKKIQIAFVLPNDEGKYYQDFPQDIEKMLRKEFGASLSGMQINITFLFFLFGDTLSLRPYIDKNTTKTINADEIIPYFDFISNQQPPLQVQESFALTNKTKE